MKPGTLLGYANRVLASHGRKLGPDPASTDIACVGGVIANNSGGMRCGTTADSYSTVAELTFVLPSGTTIDTGAPGAEEAFAAAEPALAAGAGDDPRRDPRRRRAEPTASAASSRSRTRRATGSARSWTRTRPWRSSAGCWSAPRGRWPSPPRPCSTPCRCCPKTTTSWVHFESIEAACEPVPDLVAAGASAVEMMVAPALMVAANSIPGAPKHWLELPPTSAALLVEFRSDDEADLPVMEAKAAEVLVEPRADPRAGVHAGSRDRRAQLAGPRGPARADRPAAPAGHRADHRGRLRARRPGSPSPRPTSRRCSASTAS